MNNFKYTNSNKRYHTLDYYYKNRFHEKVFNLFNCVSGDSFCWKFNHFDDL